MSSSAPAPAGAVALQGTYDPGSTYPNSGNYVKGTGSAYEPNPGGSYDFQDSLTPGQAYRYRNWGGANSDGTSVQTIAAACNSATSSDAVKSAACQVCVSARGYWLNPDVADNDVSANAGVFSANWLRFNPPKWVLLHLAYKRLVMGPLLRALRGAVLSPNGAVGAKEVQKMLPQSCNGGGASSPGILSQKLDAITPLKYSNTAKPLAEMLFNTGWYMGGGDHPATSNIPWIFASASTYPSPMPTSSGSAGKAGPCNNCSGDFAVLFSDGRNDAANPSCDGAAAAAFCTATSDCSATGALGMGTEDDGDDFLDPALVGGAGSTITDLSVRQTPGGTCNFDFADDVARFLANNDMKPGTPSRIRTYVVGIGDTNNTYGEMSTLEAIASEGDGLYVAADNFTDLEYNIERVFLDIVNRATSFSAAAITSVQTRGSTSAFIPRFQPNETSKWSGALARYQLYNEFAAGCTESDWGVQNDVNPNANSSCTDFYLRSSDGGFVAENSSGEFVMLDNTATWDGGWPFMTSADGGNVAAGPLWEASAKLEERVAEVIAGDATKARKIYTAQPNGSGGYNSAAIAFSVANVATITPLLKLGGVNGDTCLELSGRSRNVYNTEEECATDVIRFMHGEDVLMETPENRITPVPSPLLPRPNILGDIFHSTPILVVPPVPTFLCDLGVATQCTASLYLPSLTPDGFTAYDTYAKQSGIFDRKQFVLVGSNDGMLHAFHSGSYVSGAAFQAEYDLGTGEELWAFIPPDMMPKLVRYMLGSRHELLVDGTPMVRDIWADGSGATAADYVKQSDEYHTIAVVGEREGGRHYFALDVTDPTVAPTFLWSFPQAGSTAGLAMGQTWNDLGPNAPPIGAIAELDPSGPLTVGGQQAKERFIVAFGGGYDPAYLRGRSIHFVDAWTGAQVFRYARVDAAGVADPRLSLHSVAAPVSMIDTDSDGLFDYSIVGDVAGQVWTVSMSNPGEDTDADGRYDNWYGARAFIQFDGQPIARRAPFFQRAVAAQLDTGEFRVYLGSGDRAQIKDPNGGSCGMANMSACLRKGCAVNLNASVYDIGGHYVHEQLVLASGASALATNTYSTDGLGQVAACTDVLDGQLDVTVTCPSFAGQTWSSDVYCDWGADGGVNCPIDTGRTIGTSVCTGNGETCLVNADCCSGSCSSNVCAALPYTASQVQNTRFYSIKLFESGSSRAQFSTSAAALAYDGAALTDTNLIDVNGAGVATASDNGWWINHSNTTAVGYSGLSSDERSANSALILGGCVLWNTLRPNPVNTITCGGSLPLDTTYAYQADAVTGAIQCGMVGAATYTAVARSVSRSTYAAPQQPAPVVSVNSATGQVMYGGVSLDPGTPPSATTIGSGDIFGTVHWLEVPRSVHECRHAGNCN